MVVVQEIQFESIFPKTIESWRIRAPQTFGMKLLWEKGRWKNKKLRGWGPQPRAEGHSLGEWWHLINYQEINPVWDWDLSLGLRAILWENGGAW